MKLSARNSLTGIVVDITRGQVMAKVKLDIGGQVLISLISADAVDDLGLVVGEEATAIIKSTEVILAK